MTTPLRRDPLVLVQAPTAPSRPPALVPFWYMVCAGNELRHGAVRRFELGGRSIALFRGRETGVVRSLPANCVHQGADLGQGEVIGDRLRCPLHHWEFGDRCERIPGSCEVPASLAVPRYETAERFGMIFVHAGPDPLQPVPGFSVDDADLHFRPGRPVTIDCPWYVPVANAFDMTHLETVHGRTLTSAPVISRPDSMTFHVRYSTAVTGRGWSDQAMRFLSGNDIRVHVTCAGGTMVIVESLVGRRRGYLMASLRPVKDGVSILPLFGVPRGSSGLHRIHGRVAALLFTEFLRRDVRPLSGIRFPDNFTDAQDETIDACYRYLCQLPDTPH